MDDIDSQRICDNLVGIQSQDPVRFWRELIESPVELGGIVHPWVFQYLSAAYSSELHRPVCRAAVYHEAAVGNGCNGRERPLDVAFFVFGENDDGEGQCGIMIMKW